MHVPFLQRRFDTPVSDQIQFRDRLCIDTRIVQQSIMLAPASIISYPTSGYWLPGWATLISDK